MIEPCDKGHDPCEGGALHIKARDESGCAQFQDGSWITKRPCHEPHEGGQDGDAGLTVAWLEASFARNRR